MKQTCALTSKTRKQKSPAIECHSAASAAETTLTTSSPISRHSNRRSAMRLRNIALIAAASLMLFGSVGVLALSQARAARVKPQASMALTGKVTSAEEGAMEGVLVSAKKVGSTI